MSFDPKYCPLCSKKLDIEFDIKDDNYTDVIIYSCSDCGWERQR